MVKRRNWRNMASNEKYETIKVQREYSKRNGEGWIHKKLRNNFKAKGGQNEENHREIFGKEEK